MLEDQVVGLGRVVLDVEELKVDEIGLVHEKLPLVRPESGETWVQAIELL